MSASFVLAAGERARDVQRAIDDRKYERIANSMIIDGDADVLARVLREMADEGKVVEQKGPVVTVGDHSFSPLG